MKNRIINHLIENISIESKVAILCGHYALFPEGNYVFPGIYQDNESPELEKILRSNPYSAEFPVESFLFGLDLKNHFKDSKFINLVNDWMYVPKKESGDHLANEFRKEYYKNTGIPCFFKFLIQRRGVDFKNTFLEVPENIRYQNNRYHFSEQVLRNRYNNQKDKKYQQCSLSHGCAQEFVPLIEILVSLGITTLIAHVPGTCTEPVTAGIREVKSVLKLPITIYSIHTYNSLSIRDFWSEAELYVDGFTQEF